MFVKNLAIVMVSAVLAGGLTHAAFADEDPGMPLLKDAKALFAARGEGKAADAAAKAVEAQNAAVDPAVKYDAMIVASAAYYYVGNHFDDNSKKKENYNLGMAQAKAAQDLGKAQAALADPAEGFYFYALNLGQWAQANGIVASLGRKNELLAAFRDTLARKTRDAKAGETLDGFGTYRSLGRLYFKLPSFAGGSRVRSLEYLRKAVAADGSYVLNWFYLADTLADGNEGERTEAKALLNDLLKRDTQTLNPDRIPENTEEMERARKLLADLG